MPLYDYLCDSCGASFEKTMSMQAESLTQCPTCGSGATHRTFLTPPMVVIFNEDRFTRQLSPKGKRNWEKAKEKVGL